MICWMEVARLDGFVRIRFDVSWMFVPTRNHWKRIPPKGIFLKIFDCCEEEFWHKNHFTGGFRWICIIGTSRKSLSHLSKATSRWGSCDTPGQCQDFRCSSRTIASEATFGEEKCRLNTADGCAESAEKFNMPQCHELLWLLNMLCIVTYSWCHMAQRQTWENGEGNFKINKLTIIPSSWFPVCHGSDFSSSWSYVDLSFSWIFYGIFIAYPPSFASTRGIGPLNACGNG